MIRHDELDRLAEHLAAEILDRHAHGGDRSFTGLVGELTRHVGQDADLHHIVGYAVGERGSRSDPDRHSQ